jgi:hypothetical protein
MNSRAVKRYSLLGVSKRLRDHYPDRYMVTNHQNMQTIEVRVFRSTRSADEFRDSVGLVIDTAEYVRELERQKASVSV